MRRLFALLVLVNFLTSFKPGEPVAILTGKSESGRTTFTAELPSCSYLDKAGLSNDGSMLLFTVEDRSNIIFEPDNKLFTVSLESKSDNPKTYKFLRQWALPSSFKKVKSEKGPGTEFHGVYEFNAKVYATEPRKINESTTKIIELIRTLDYEL